MTGFLTWTAPARARVGGVRGLAFAMVVAAACGAARAQPAIAGDDAAQLLHRVTDTQVPPGAREAAANRLVTSDDRRALALLEDLLRAEGGERAPARAAVLAAVSRVAEPSASLFAPICAFLTSAPADEADEAIESLGSFRTKASVEMLLGRAGPSRPAPERAAAFKALVRITGRDDFGESLERWTGWFDRLREADEARWQAALAAGLASRADRLSADRADAMERLAETTRRLYLAHAQAAQPAEQPKLLASLLISSRDELRSLGFDILSRELSSARSIDPAVETTVVGLLRDPNPAVRSRAAILVRQLNPAGAVDAVARALAIEEVPDAASALLLAAARWPSEAVRAPAIRWLSNGRETRSASVQALLVLARSGLLYDPAEREKVASVLRGSDLQTFTPAECRLLAMTGTPEDLERLAGLLQGPPSPLRTSAAEALADSSRYLGAVVAAADRDLFEAATRAVIAQWADAQGFAWIASLDAPTPEVRRSALLRVSAVLPTSELITAARATEVPIREAMLSRLAESSVPGDATPDSLGAGLLLLAEARLHLKRPESAIMALDAIPFAVSESMLVSISRARTIALLWAGRINEAEDVNAPAEVWLDGLEQCLQEPHAIMVAAVITDRFGENLSAAESERLQALRRLIAEAPGPPATNANGPP